MNGEWLRGWFHSGRIVDAILALMALEAALLLARRSGDAGFRIAGPLASLASGAGLLLALKLALVGGAWSFIALALGGAGLAHGYDLMTRLRAEDREINSAGHERCVHRQRRMIFVKRSFSEVFRR